MKSLLFCLLLVSVTAAAQKNQIAITAEGNLNPVTYSYIKQPLPVMEDSQKSSVGVGVQFDHWFNPRFAFGVRFEQNPSDGREKEGNNAITDIWPQSRREIFAIFAQRPGGARSREFQIHKFTPFLQEGVGAILTCECSDGNKHRAGFSDSTAFAAGSGTEYSLNEKFNIRISFLIIATATGCYDDSGCRPTMGLSHDLGLGFTWKWGTTASENRRAGGFLSPRAKLRK